MAFLPFITGAIEALPEIIEVAEPLISAGAQLFGHNPSPAPNGDIDTQQAQSVIPVNATDDVPATPAPEIVAMSARQSSNTSGRDSADYSAPALLGRQAIAYDPRQRVSAPSFLGHSTVTPVPFSFKISALEVPQGDSWTTTLTIAQSVKGIEKLKSLIEPWRFAKLRSLEAIFLPTFYVSQMDFQIDSCWSTDSQPTFDENNITEHLAHTRMVFAGGVSQSANTIVPAPLGQINSVIKDSAAYIDTPRFNAFVKGVKHDKQHDKVVILDVIIRGVLEVGDISLY